MALWSDNWLGRKAGGGAWLMIYLCLSAPDNVSIMPPISEVDGHRFARGIRVPTAAQWDRRRGCLAEKHKLSRCAASDIQQPTEMNRFLRENSPTETDSCPKACTPPASLTSRPSI